MVNKKIYDLLIIGAGPGGLTASIYAKRSNLDVAFIEKSAPGGKVSWTSIIENYPGFTSISGHELASKMYEQTKSLDIPHIYGEVIFFKKEKNNFIVETNDNKKYFSKALILATGMTENKFNIPGENKFQGKGISYCAICDGSFYKNKIVAVLGGGNSALKESRYLAKIAKKVYLVHRFQEFEGQKFEVDLTKKVLNIEIMVGRQMTSFNGDKKLESISFKNIQNGKEQIQEIDGAFSFIGYKPLTNYVNEDLVDLNNKFIVTNNLTKTKTPGIFAVGDVTIKPYRQIITAESDGVIAALEVEKYISSI